MSRNVLLDKAPNARLLDVFRGDAVLRNDPQSRPLTYRYADGKPPPDLTLGSTPAGRPTYFLSESRIVSKDGPYYTWDQIYFQKPASYDEPANYQLSTYIIKENAIGWNSQGSIPPGAQQVAREVIQGADQELNYVSGVLVSSSVTPRRRIINFTHPDGWSGFVSVTNANPNAQLEVTVWGASAGRKAPLGVEDDIIAITKHDFFLVGPQAHADYAETTDVPVFAAGDVYSAGLYVLEPPSLTRWQGNIYERVTLVSDQILTRKFTY